MKCLQFINVKSLVPSYVTFIILFCLTGCGNKHYAEIKWCYNDKDISGDLPPKSDQIDANIFVDATTSMRGFTVNSGSSYNSFLVELQAYLLSAWPKTNIQYYKFGEKVFKIGDINKRDDFLQATKPTFYPGPKNEIGADITQIDSAIDNSDNGKLNIIITDLFENFEDATKMTQSIKDKCLAKGVQVGILGITSEFHGRVYDCPMCPYQLDAKDRPFYVLCFGHSANMIHLFDALKKLPFIKRDQFLIISNFILNSSVDSLAKTADSKFIVNRKTNENIPNVFNFSLKKEGNYGSFNLTVNVDRNPIFADFNVNELKLEVYKKSISDEKFSKRIDSVLSQDITVSDIKRVGNRIVAILHLKNTDPEGNYSYQVRLKTDQLAGLVTPKWVSEFSSSNPSLTKDSNKTLNLDDLFISKLIQANSSFFQPTISKFYINIYKR